jgi:hypothetical protein
MPVNVTFPGVYIDELPSAVRTIVGVPTSITAFIGSALRGDVDEATHITSWSDFEREFGGLSDDSVMSYAVFHYFQNGGSEAEIVRVTVDDAARAELKLADDVTLEAASPGAWGGKLRARVDHNTKPQDPNGPKLFNLTIRDTGTGAEESFRNVEAKVGSPRALSRVLRASSLVRPKKSAVNDATQPDASPDVDPGADPFADPKANPLTLTKKANPTNFANVGDKITYSYELANAGPAPLDGPFKVADDKLGDVDLGDGPLAGGQKLGPVTKEYTVVQADVDAKAITNTATAKGKDAESDAVTTTVLAPGGQAPPAPDPTPGPFVQASDPGDDDPIAADDLKKGFPLLEKLGNRLFNLLCIPWAEDLSFLDEAAKLCVDHRAVLLVDPPTEWASVEDAVDGASNSQGGTPLGISGDNQKNAAAYFPRLQLLDEHGNAGEYPPSGAVAGVLARTDAQRGVWKAPAGTDASVAGVQDLVVAGKPLRLTNLENGELNPLGINCIRNFPIIGTVVWGARTLRGADQLADQWKYLPVRRTALFIEESLYRGTQWVVFEPNDEPLWSSIRLNVGAFMNSLWRQGAFQGKTPQEAYLVKCDSENNPQNDIDRGIVNILVGFAPLKPAEFVLIHIQQLAGQIQT